MSSSLYPKSSIAIKIYLIEEVRFVIRDLFHHSFHSIHNCESAQEIMKKPTVALNRESSFADKGLKGKDLLIYFNESHTKECGFDSSILYANIFIKALIDEKITSLTDKLGIRFIS